MSADLQARAERAASAIIAEHDLAILGVPHPTLVALLAVGWLEGWQDGGDTAKALIQDALAQNARAGIHSVPS